MHTRVPIAADAQSSTSTRNASEICHLPPFPPTESIKDSTDELYLTVPYRPSSAGSPGSSPTSSLSSDRSSLMSGSLRIKDVAKKATRRRRRDSSIIALEDDIQKFQGAPQRRSYFSSAKKRELIQFGPMVCFPINEMMDVNFNNYFNKLGCDNDRFLLWIY